jgi:beta-glucanase (GH16 family)
MSFSLGPRAFLLLLALVCLHCARANRKNQNFEEHNRDSDQVVFYDDFEEFDLSIWQHEITASGEGNGEFEYYTNNRINSYVRDSVLFLKPTLTADSIGEQALISGTLDLWGGAPADLCTGNEFNGCFRQGGERGNIINPIQSARIRTVQSFSFKYGRLEVRAKLPRGDWIWPAIWMLPTYNSYGTWPKSGEIDIMESRGNVGYSAGGINQFCSTLHWGPGASIDPWPLTHGCYSLPAGDFADDFHVFGLTWSNNTIYTYLDQPSNVVLTVDMTQQSFWEKGGWQSKFNNPWTGRGNDAPFDQKFYIIFNVAVGGTGGYFPDGMANKPWSNSDPNAVNSFWKSESSWYSTWKQEDAAMQIDWIKVYQ